MSYNSEVGQRRLSRAEPPRAELISRFAKLATTDLSDAMHQSGVMQPGIRSIYSTDVRCAGPAVTVFVPSGSQEVRREAMASAQPGDVLVISSPGILGSVLGGKLAKILADKGVAGVVIDGYVRDVSEIQNVGLPVFCRGHIPAAAPKVGPGEVNVPIACGGAVVAPGDIVVADWNGVVVVPRDAAEAVATKVLSS
ncbi:RraA family protein [Ensifer adhaerens]|uniref:RraA family protein n=1 Tax=Ensifer adhaerens TaxID=106592 RepID=UPI0023A98B69|nr:RraA family protein [Ensifer adhaerens]WDZ76244.1 RraA family protein [Ensifer adhaerens]